MDRVRRAGCLIQKQRDDAAVNAAWVGAMHLRAREDDGGAAFDAI
jgi:hypothetical protein